MLAVTESNFHPVIPHHTVSKGRLASSGVPRKPDLQHNTSHASFRPHIPERVRIILAAQGDIQVLNAKIDRTYYASIVFFGIMALTGALLFLFIPSLSRTVSECVLILGVLGSVAFKLEHIREVKRR